MNLAKSLKKRRQPKRRKEPLWRGPEVDGVTQSLLGRFLQCRERFRLLVVEGLRPAPSFNHRTEYGQMWHVCEEEHAVTNPRETAHDWQTPLRKYCEGLCKKYRTQQEQVQHWCEVCRVQFPLYVEYWRKHPDVKARTPLLQEYEFDVPYSLPSGRVVRLRGKWDSVDLIGKGKDTGVYLQENKTKGDIDEPQLKRQLSSGFDLQTMFYLVALEQHAEGHVLSGGKIRANVRGVRYNVVRRPLSGGRGSIVRHKPSKGNPEGEGRECFYERVGEVIKGDLPYFFMRWKVEVSAQDVARFRRECLDPILEELYDWWELINWQPHYAPLEHQAHHFRYPYGVYNVLQEGGSGELDEYMSTGSDLGLTRTDGLFPELSP